MSKRIVAPKNWVRQAHVDAARQAAKIAVTFYRCGKREGGFANLGRQHGGTGITVPESRGGDRQDHRPFSFGVTG